jgi:N-acetylmuramoyl-L-alanine amidase
MKRILTGFLVWIATTGAVLAATEFEGVRLWAAPDHTRVVFDTSGPVSHKLFPLANPNRLVIDVETAVAAETLETAAAVGGLVKGIRTAINKPGMLRIVLDLKQSAKPRSFNLSPNERYGHRLVVDLYEQDAQATAKKVVASKPAALRDLVIAIDAGHGGDDPGAVGRHGTREKDVVFSIAKRLAKLVRAEPGMRPVMVREGDYYIGLRKRIDRARKHGADLFISIHADGFRDHRASGSSVYVLSRRGASSEMARVLAAKENAADLAGGVSLVDKDELLREVLLDLSQTATLEASFEVAENMLGELKRIGKTHKRTVQQAGFLVLKSPDIPSILVETAFITNPSEENRLRNQKHQQKLARAMLRGIKDYFGRYPPPGTNKLARQYVVKSGDTLSHIAQRYHVSLNTLRGYNDLKSDTVRVGDKLRIPPTRDS